MNRFREVESEAGDIDAFISLIDAELSDGASEEDLSEEISELSEMVNGASESAERLSMDLLLSERYDDADAILSVHAGTGGVDAMDWAEMLLRMYIRFCESEGFKVRLVDLQNDTVAGIKSATLMVDGRNAYGYLKCEQGVHRLVRISPFNAAGKRQTSFAAVEVIPQLDDEIVVNIDENDLEIDRYRSTGAGGQSVNTTDSAIRITHKPTGIVVTCQNERSQLRNKEVALKILASKLQKLAEEEQKESISEIKGDVMMNTWGSQIRSYVFQPYTMVKDNRTGAETGNVNAVMDGDLMGFIRAKLLLDAKNRA